MKRMYKPVALVLAMVVLCLPLVSCGRPLPEHLENFTVEQAAEDFTYMWEYLSENSPYIFVAERMYGFDAEELYLEYLRRIEVKQTISVKSFYDLCGEFLSHFGQTGHVLFVPAEFYSYLYQGVDRTGHPYSGYEWPYLADEKTMAAYQYMGAKMDGIATLPGTSSRGNVTVEMVGDNAVLIKVKSFSGDYIESDWETIQDAYTRYADKEYLLIDIQGNGGGSDIYWIDNFVRPNLTEPAETLPKPILLMGGSDIEETFVPRYPGISEDFSEIEALPNVNREDLEKLKYYFMSGYNRFEPLYEEPMFYGEIVVFIDGGVSSASEGFASFCKDTGFATLIGPNSGGGTPKIHPECRAMPNSGFLFRFQVDYSLNSDGSLNAEVGTAPDYTCRENETPIQAFQRVKRIGDSL